jgi:uncharacterized protein YcbX
MTGTDAWAEHGWGGQTISIGEAIVRVIAPVPRYVVTTRSPDSGATDARVLHALARLRGQDDIAFGVWCDIIRPGRILPGLSDQRGHLRVVQPDRRGVIRVLL